MAVKLKTTTESIMKDWILKSHVDIFFQEENKKVVSKKQPQTSLKKIMVFMEGEMKEKLKLKTLHPTKTLNQFCFVMSKKLSSSVYEKKEPTADDVIELSVSLFNQIKKQSILEGEKEVSIHLSSQVRKLIDPFAQEFFLGFLQYSISNKISLKNTASLSLFFPEEKELEQAFLRAKKLSLSMTLCRSLINMPANILNPETFVSLAQEIIKRHQGLTKGKIRIEEISKEKLLKENCNLICAVGAGSVIPPRILKLSYTPKVKAKKKISLVGKGITYDTGGLDLKPSSSMRLMKKDMAGAASCFGTFLAAAFFDLPLEMTSYLGLAENMVSSHSYRPGDVYKTHHNLTVEIDNTDAEGRLALADCLYLASQENPDWIIDVATLTGAARSALGPLVDPYYGNKPECDQLLEKASLKTGDWVWKLPLVEGYESYFSSHVADMMNSSPSGFAGSIIAALFLKKFVTHKGAWTHIDSYMWADKSHGLYAEVGPTAKCVRLLLEALTEFSKK